MSITRNQKSIDRKFEHKNEIKKDHEKEKSMNCSEMVYISRHKVMAESPIEDGKFLFY